MVAEILKLLPIELRSVFKAEVDGPSVILHYNDVHASVETRRNDLHDAERYLRSGKYTALTVGRDIYVAERAQLQVDRMERAAKVFGVSVPELLKADPQIKALLKTLEPAEAKK